MHSLWSSVRTGNEDADIDGDDRKNDAEEGNGCKLADELHPEEDPDKHYDEEYSAINTIVIESYRGFR